MRRIFRRALAVTIAFALVASAAAWRQCTALQLAVSAASIEYVSHAAHQHTIVAEHEQNDHRAVHHRHAAADPATPPVADDHGCMKCCTICAVANAVLPASDATPFFTVSAHVFSRHQ